MTWYTLTEQGFELASPPEYLALESIEMDVDLERIDVKHYARSRNYLNGAVTEFSPLIEHGLLESKDIVDWVKANQDLEQSDGFLMQVAWRDYFQQRWHENPDAIWTDVGEYKTGFTAEDYSDELPEDIIQAQTPVAFINQIIEALIETGYIHNHARLYLAGYIVHFRRIKWQAGAKWMLSHLLDGNLGSNNFSWQWVASTGSNKPYFYNLENVQKFADDRWDTSYENNSILAGTYEELHARLFPNLKGAK